MDALGSAQPWISVPLESLREWMAAAGVTTVVVDGPVPPDMLHWRPADVEELASELATRQQP